MIGYLKQFTTVSPVLRTDRAKQAYGEFLQDIIHVLTEMEEDGTPRSEIGEMWMKHKREAMGIAVSIDMSEQEMKVRLTEIAARIASGGEE